MTKKQPTTPSYPTLGIYKFLRYTCLYFDFSDVSVEYNLENDVMSFLFLKEGEYFIEMDEYTEELSEEELLDVLESKDAIVQVDFTPACLDAITLESFLTIVSIEVENHRNGNRTIIH